MKNIRNVLFVFGMLLGISCMAQTLEEVKAHNLTEQASETILIHQVKERQEKLKDLMKITINLNLDKSQVNDETVIDELDKQMEIAKEDSQKEVKDTPNGNGYDAFEEQSKLKETVSYNRALVQEMDQSVKALTDAIDAAKYSKLKKDIDEIRTKLEKRVKDATDLLASSEGNVMDDSIRDSLAGEIKELQKVLTSDTISEDVLKTLSNGSEKLESEITNVENSVQEYEEYQAYIASQAPHASSSSSESSGGAWNVDYTTNYRTYDLGNGVTQWEDRYYVAHSNTPSGQNIASRPGSVVVDGRSYHYVSSMSVPPGTDWTEVESFVHANGGIGFQTCNADGSYLITHYEPD